MQPLFVRLRCPRCHSSTSCGADEIANRLLVAGKLRRGSQPEWEILVELFRAAAQSFGCDDCGAEGMIVGPADDGEDDGDWGGGKNCEACGRPIASERLQALPATTLCTDCASKEEAGESLEPREFCPRCGAVMTLRQRTTGGLTRYQMICPGCRG